jgi:PAS domain S-box-containing protein
MTRLQHRSGALPAGRDFLRTDAKTDVVGDRNHLILVGMAAVWFTLLVFTVQRLVVALQTGLLTPWWGNAAGLVALTALWAWYRRRPQTRSSGAAHGTALIATITLLIPVAYGLTSTVWWLSLVGFAAVMLGRRQEAKVWGVTIPLVMVASVIAEPYVQIQGVAGELPLELALAKIVFVVILIGMAVGFRRVVEQRALVLHDSEAQSTEAMQKIQDLLIQAEKLGRVGGWEFDIETKQQTWTDMVYEIHELDVTGHPTVDQGINYYTPASRPIIERAVQRAIEQGEPFDVELEIITAKGNLRSVHAIGKADPACRKVSGFFQDITERKKAEQTLIQSRRAALNMMTDAVAAREQSEQLSKKLKKHRDHLEQLVEERTGELKKSEEKFRTVADFAYDWEYWIDADRRMLYVSPSCERITGHTQENFYKYPTLIDTIVHPDDRAVFQAHVDDYHVGTKRRDSADWSFRIMDSRGNMHWIGHICHPVTGEDGTYKGRRVSNRDITEGKKAEMAIQGFNESLRRSNVELQASNSELEAFAYSVSHDLRAPLRTIDGFSHALLEDYDDKLGVQGKDYLRRVRASTQRMAQLIDDILKLSRVTRSEMNIEKVNLTQIAWSIVNELQKSQPERLINIKIAEGLEDTADPRLMRVALENLLGNAWKFTGKQSEAVIEFGSTKEGEKKVYFIRDNGAGFDMAYADKLFAPFQRLHTLEEYAGTGIGLATVQRIARRHGGKVWAEGQVGKGATFYFSLQ